MNSKYTYAFKFFDMSHWDDSIGEGVKLPSWYIWVFLPNINHLCRWICVVFSQLKKNCSKLWSTNTSYVFHASHWIYVRCWHAIDTPSTSIWHNRNFKRFINYKISRTRLSYTQNLYCQAQMNHVVSLFFVLLFLVTPNYAVNIIPSLSLL